ncbi:MAG: hypothetical protein RIR00_1501 [Pseudomonadota bacterium]|jgi:hypothetical protein
MSQKLILPAEVKVCATCTYWDGERRVDDELQVVVVAEDCAGVCLVTETDRSGLTDAREPRDCLWDDLNGDKAEETKPPTAAG